jgi:hypothetical protein
MPIQIKRVIFWGHKIHTTTHSYIHAAFVKAFIHLGYKTFWLDQTDELKLFSMENTLFITEGQQDDGIPIRDDCYYVLYNCDASKYATVSKKMNIQVYTDDVKNKSNCTPITGNDACYQDPSCLYMPWATDLLPEEINTIINDMSSVVSDRHVSFVGKMTAPRAADASSALDNLGNTEDIKNDTTEPTMADPWLEVRNWCKQHQIEFRQYGGNTDRTLPLGGTKHVIQQSLVAPAVQNNVQVENGYIPCRIFKNISYGKMGMTNSARVNELFGNRLLYDSNIATLMDMGVEFEEKPEEERKKIIIPLMEYVRDHHTYLNRIELIINFLEQLSS